VTREEVFEAFRLQATGLEAGGADALCIETFMDLEEAIIAINAAKLFTNLEIACTFTFQKTISSGYRTLMGHSVEDVVKAIQGEGVDIIGANCGNRIENMIDIAKEIRDVEPDLPLLVQPNAGAPSVKDGTIAYPDSAEKMASMVHYLVEGGANIIGGCCGTTPEYIEEFAGELEKLR
jgi:5-methyltetrahydrofolate--homocysteine methyltransferase